MKKRLFSAALFAALMVSSPHAFALSVEQAPVNSDGSAKFSDPDEKTPFGVTSSESAAPNNGAGVTEPYMGSPYTPPVMNMEQGQGAFDHAYNHLNNQH